MPDRTIYKNDNWLSETLDKQEKLKLITMLGIFYIKSYKNISVRSIFLLYLD